MRDGEEMSERLTRDEHHSVLVGVQLHLASDPLAVKVRVPPALLTRLVITVLVRRTHKRDAEEPLVGVALPCPRCRGGTAASGCCTAQGGAGLLTVTGRGGVTDSDREGRGY